MTRVAEGAIPSPNIWRTPEVYELENRAVDPDGVIEKTMLSLRPWEGATILDLGCGSGFHLPGFAAVASRVVGVEPHPGLVDAARRRTHDRANVRVLQGAAQQIPLPDASVDIMHARWAYFFGPACEPGLAEVSRVVRRGGVGFIIDNDATRSTFGRWFQAAYPEVDTVKTDLFFSQRGWTDHRELIRWEFERRQDLEAVVRIEFPPDLADRILAEHAGCEVDYAITIRVRRF